MKETLTAAAGAGTAADDPFDEVSIALPAACGCAELAVAIDVGGSAIKVVTSEGSAFRAPAERLDALLRHVAAHGPALVATTGGGALRHERAIAAALGGGDGAVVTRVDEMAAVGAGVRALDAAAGGLVDEAGAPAARRAGRVVVVSIGTGTSVLVLEPAPCARAGRAPAPRRVAGTCFGAGTFVGLVAAVCGDDALGGGGGGGARAHGAARALAARGANPAAVDATVGDIYGARTAELGLPPDLLAASFAKAPALALGARRGPDAAASLATLAAWTIGQLGAWVARAERAERVVFVGGLVDALFIPKLAFPVGFETGGAAGAAFPEGGAAPYVGAIGALARALAERPSARARETCCF